MPTLEEIWTERGYQKGLQYGFQQGLQLGIQQCQQEIARQAVITGIEVVLEIKFGLEGLKLLPDIAKIEDISVLRAVLRGVKAAATPDDIRRIYT